jgi:sugar lactone lactonase YvrE
MKLSFTCISIVLLIVLAGMQMEGCKSKSTVSPLMPTPTFTATVIPVTIYCGSCGSGNGQFNMPADIGISPSGYLYVADNRNYRVQELSLACGFVRTWGSLGTGDGQFYDKGYGTDGPVGLRFDANGNVFVCDYLYSVQKFDASGNFIKKISNPYVRDVTVDKTTGDVYCSGFNQMVFHYDNNLNFITSWGSSGTANNQFTSLTCIEIDSTHGWLYCGDMGNCRIKKFDTAGNYITCFGGSTPATQTTSTAIDIALDSADEVYISSLGDRKVDKYDPTGNHLMTWSFPAGPTGLAIDSSGWMYVALITTCQIAKVSSTGGSLP